jgi:hypothetical protein
MSKFAVILCFALCAVGAQAQVATPPPPIQQSFRTTPGARMHTSLTQQFEIREPNNLKSQPIPLGNTTGYVRVDPTLLPVSCERIKHAFLSELGALDNWRSKIYIDMRRARSLNEGIIIDSEPLGRDWTYHVSLPDTVNQTRLVTSLVDTLLLEMANRNANRSAEIPAWLGYGLTEDILRSAHIEMVLEPAKPNTRGIPFSYITASGTNTNVLAVARANLQSTPPLTLDQLSWPDDSRLDGPNGETFRSSAQLYVHELLQLPDGRAAMRAFIQELPQHLNWQLSFLHAFRNDFATQLALEKWWALRVVDFSGRDVSETLSAEESWQKLQEILRPVVDVRSHVNELPSRKQMTLQTIIEKWDAPRQVSMLKERSKMLFTLRSRVSQEMAKLTDDYRRTIDVYLDKRHQAGYLRTPLTREVMGLDEVEKNTIDDLNILDSIGQDLRPKAEILQSADAGGSVKR